MLRQNQIEINDDYFDLVPRPSKEDRHSLKQSILEDGQQYPIIINEKGIILDGHTRFEICQELHLKPKFSTKKFGSIEEEGKFVILANVARRNLNLFQKVELAWEIYENEKRRAHEREYGQGGPNEAGVSRRYGPKKEGNSSEIFGRYMGTGHTMIMEIQWLKENAPKEVLQQLRDGKVSITRTYDFLRGLVITRGKNRKKPKRPTECALCGYHVITKRKRKCHVHKWYCCGNTKVKCRWGI